MIDKVYVLNLPHRADRRWYTMGHLHTIGVHPNRVCIYEAKYGKDYESIDAIMEAAKADGFDFPDPDEDIHKTRFSYRWNWCRMLRDIIASGEMVLILIDDRMITIDWDLLNWCVRDLVENQPPFKILQMGWWHSFDSQADAQRANSKKLEVVNGLAGKGFGGYGDFGTVVNAAGAQDLMNYILGNRSPEFAAREYFQIHGDEIGCFHLINSSIDNFSIDWGEDMVQKI